MKRLQWAITPEDIQQHGKRSTESGKSENKQPPELRCENELATKTTGEMTEESVFSSGKFTMSFWPGTELQIAHSSFGIRSMGPEHPIQKIVFSQNTKPK